MTKKDFELIARAIHDIPLMNIGDDGPRVRDAVAKRFASDLRAENPRFDRARFLKACGVEA